MSKFSKISISTQIGVGGHFICQNFVPLRNSQDHHGVPKSPLESLGVSKSSYESPRDPGVPMSPEESSGVPKRTQKSCRTLRSP